MKSLTIVLATAMALSVTAGLVTGAGAAVAPTKPKPPVGETVSNYTCGGELGYLRRVYEAEIDLIERASIVPVCESEDFGLMRSEGNAGAIRQHIAGNDDIMDALFAANFGIEDVVGVRMTGDESAVIYVHTFHYR